MAWRGQRFPCHPQSRVFPGKSLVLSRGGLSDWVLLQPLCSQLGHDELLIVALEQIGSRARATPGQPCGKRCWPGRPGSGPLGVLMLFPLLCGYSDPLRRTGMGLGTWALHEDLSQLKYF